MEYYVYIDGEQKGPFSKDQVLKLFSGATISSDTLIWCQDYSDWKKISETEFYNTSKRVAPTSAPTTSSAQISNTNTNGYIPFNLLDNEKVILKTLSNTTILTSYRLYNRTTTWSGEYNNAIYLEDISSIEYGSKNRIWLLILAILLAVASILAVLKGMSLSTTLPAIVVFALWWLLRKKALIVTPNGGKHISIVVGALSGSELNNLIDSLHKAKSERVDHLNSK